MLNNFTIVVTFLLSLLCQFNLEYVKGILYRETSKQLVCTFFVNQIIKNKSGLTYLLTITNFLIYINKSSKQE